MCIGIVFKFIIINGDIHVRTVYNNVLVHQIGLFPK